MNSGTHFAKEVATNMTSLAEVLLNVSDKVFSVKFKKQPTVESASEKLENFPFVDIKDQKKLSALVKDIVEG
jgi:hypothetical protein